MSWFDPREIAAIRLIGERRVNTAGTRKPQEAEKKVSLYSSL
jgi:hypothetical protein